MWTPTGGALTTRVSSCPCLAPCQHPGGRSNAPPTVWYHRGIMRTCLGRHAPLLAVATVLFGALLATTVDATRQSAPPDGAALYRALCASCHGTSGRGDGPVAGVLRVAPANLTQLAQRHGGTFRDDQVARAIDGRTRIGAHGPSDMPVWGDTFSSVLAQDGEAALRARIGALVRYLASIQESQAP